MHVQKLDRAAFSASLPRQGIATVRKHSAQGWLVDDPQRSEAILAAQATSCLVVPAIGDRVWIVGEGEEHFITAVLARPAAGRASGGAGAGEGAAPMVLAVEGALELRASGTLRLRGEHVELEGQRSLALRSADELSIEAKRGRVLLRALEAFVSTLRASTGESTFIAKVASFFAERFTQTSNTSYRSVAESDLVRAGTLDYRAEKGAHIHGENTSMSAAELVKVDAGQIHLG